MVIVRNVVEKSEGGVLGEVGVSLVVMGIIGGIVFEVIWF